VLHHVDGLEQVDVLGIGHRGLPLVCRLATLVALLPSSL
jgi:hypothetical protein